MLREGAGERAGELRRKVAGPGQTQPQRARGVPVRTGALSTPRISLGEAKLAVLGVAWPGSMVWCGGWVPGGWYTGYSQEGYTGWVLPLPTRYTR